MKWQDSFVDLSLTPLPRSQRLGEELFQSNIAAILWQRRVRRIRKESTLTITTSVRILKNLASTHFFGQWRVVRSYPSSDSC